MAEVQEALQALPDVEMDEQGNVVGSGLTLRPTAHRFEVNGHQLYTWCALDTLIFPVVLQRSARIESPCHGTGTPVRVTVDATLTRVEPATAVVSLVTPDDVSSLRSAFCNHVHFFRAPAAAETWLAGHPGGSVLAVADAFALGRRLATTLLGEDPAQPTCC